MTDPEVSLQESSFVAGAVDGNMDAAKDGLPEK